MGYGVYNYALLFAEKTRIFHVEISDIASEENRLHFIFTMLSKRCGQAHATDARTERFSDKNFLWKESIYYKNTVEKI